eukprot:TRINITY_DN4597_c0_g1_i1.p1 TRINITY_DN4597_c0_g1~~TRINITY_DN4597_c0_g1_i1.p1  ORF type:complete len:287 (-),score=86.97 TRINITY_DN4597_c0_g1_i1:189-1049(-)
MAKKKGKRQGKNQKTKNNNKNKNKNKNNNNESDNKCSISIQQQSEQLTNSGNITSLLRETIRPQTQTNATLKFSQVETPIDGLKEQSSQLCSNYADIQDNEEIKFNSNSLDFKSVLPQLIPAGEFLGFDFPNEHRLKHNFSEDNSKFYKNKAQEAYKNAEYLNAIKYYTCAIYFNPFDSTIYTSRGLIYKKLGRDTEASLDILVSQRPISNRSSSSNLNNSDNPGGDELNIKHAKSIYIGNINSNTNSISVSSEQDKLDEEENEIESEENEIINLNSQTKLSDLPE